MAGMLRGAAALGHRTAAGCYRRRACEKNGLAATYRRASRDPGLR
jgi:hypothetical protein